MSKDLTKQMISDFKPYIRPRFFEIWEKGVWEEVNYFGGGVQKIEEIPFPDKPGIMEKRYYFPDGEGGLYPSYILNAFECGEKNSL